MPDVIRHPALPSVQNSDGPRLKAEVTEKEREPAPETARAFSCALVPDDAQQAAFVKDRDFPIAESDETGLFELAQNAVDRFS